jgi:hypothetical protein
MLRVGVAHLSVSISGTLTTSQRLAATTASEGSFMTDIGDRTQFFPNDDDNVTISSGIAAPRIDQQLRKVAGSITREYELKAYEENVTALDGLNTVFLPDESLGGIHDGQVLTFFASPAFDVSTTELTRSVALQFPSATFSKSLTVPNVGAVSGGAFTETVTEAIKPNKPIDVVFDTPSDKFIYTPDDPIVLNSRDANTDQRCIRFRDGTQIIHGKTTITPVANTPTSATESFVQNFISTSSMSITVSANTSVPGSVVEEVSYSGVTTSSVDIYIYRTNATPTPIHFIAHGRWF